MDIKTPAEHHLSSISELIQTKPNIAALKMWQILLLVTGINMCATASGEEAAPKPEAEPALTAAIDETPALTSGEKTSKEEETLNSKQTESVEKNKKIVRTEETTETETNEVNTTVNNDDSPEENQTSSSDSDPNTSAQADDAPPPDNPVGHAPQPKETPRTQVADILEQQSILTPRGMVVVDPQLQYSNSSVTHVTIDGYTILPALAIGSIDVRSVRRDTLTSALGLRYGATNKLEFEMRIPYVYRSDQTISRPLNSGTQENTVTKMSGGDLGDVEAAGRYQLNNGNEGAYYVATLRIKSDTGRSPFDVPLDPNNLPTEPATGTGFWAAQPSISFTKASDPAVFFGGLSYMWNKKRRVNDTLGIIEPGNSAGFNFGMGLALNQDASFNLGYSHNVVQPARQNGAQLQGSERLQVGALAIGVSYRIGQNTTFHFGLNVGVTQDAPDVQVSLSLPLDFKLHD